MLQKPHSQTTMVENYTDHNISTKLRNDSYKAPTHYTVSKRFWDLSFTWHFIGCQPRDHSRVGINHIHYECNRNKAEIPRISRTGQRRLQDIVRERRFRFAGHVTRMAPECPAHCAIGHQLMAEEKEIDQRRLGDQHLEKIYRQEESAGASKRQWQPTVCAGETCCPLFHKGLEDLR